MVFNATFNNISAILCQSILLVEETRVHRENHRPDINHWQSLSEKHRPDASHWQSLSESH